VRTLIFLTMKNRDLLVIILSAIAVFAAVSYALQLPENATSILFLGGDPPSYWDAAKRLYTEGGMPHPLRPFFYPFLIGLPAFFVGEKGFNLEWALGLNFIFWLLTVVFIFNFLKENTNRKIAFITTFIFIFNTSNIINCWSVIAESLFHFLIIGSIYFLLKFLKNKNKSIYFLVFFSLFSLSLITRPTYFPLLFILFPLFIWAIFKRYLSVFIGFISILIFLFTVGFNAFKIHQNYGNWTLSYLGHCALYSFFGAYAKVVKPDKTIKQIGENWFLESVKRNKDMPRYNDSIPWSALNSIVTNDLREQIKNNKLGLLFAFSRDLVSNSVASNGEVLLLTNFKKLNHFNGLLKTVFYWGRLQNILNTLAALFLIPFLIRRFKSFFWLNKRPIFWLLLFNSFLSIFTILISTISFTQGDRFHLVVLPLSLVSLGIIYFYKKLI
jgi:hypothetical protein